MPANSDNIYAFAPLDQYSVGQRIAIGAAGIVFYLLIRLIGATVRFELVHDVEAPATEGRPPIYAVWHDRIFLGTYYLRGRGIVFLTSQSFDGEYIARFLQRFGFGVIRGSSTRGGARGLAEMIRGIKRGLAMGFTADGPKGPRYVAKPGPIQLAKKTGSPIIPFVIEPSRYWCINSWDRLQIPWPFARALVVFGEPIEVGSESSDEELEVNLQQLQRRLDELVERGSTWRKGR